MLHYRYKNHKAKSVKIPIARAKNRFLIFSFHHLDPTEDPDEEFGGKLSQNKVHIRIQQRNGRKTITTLQGIEEKYDQKKLAKAFKKVRKYSFPYVK